MAIEFDASALFASLDASALSASLDKLAFDEIRDYFRRRNLNETLLERLEAVLLSMKTMLDEKQITDRNVLDALRDTVYQASKLVDEVHAKVSLFRLEALSQRYLLLDSFLSSFDKKIESRMGNILGNFLGLLEARGYIVGSGKQASQKLSSKSLVDGTGRTPLMKHNVTKNLTSLELVDLNLNQTLLQSTLADSIGDLRFLESLVISNTAIQELPCSKLQEFPGSIGNLMFLKYLDLSGTAIKELPDSIQLLSKLRELKLAGCSELQELPDSIGNCKLLQCLDLSGTAIKELPDSIQLLGKLRELKLAGCSELQQLPDSIGNCTLLQCLDLSGTAIKELPDSIRLLDLLRELKLAGCSELQELPDSIGNCIFLQCLDLSGTAIKELPDSIRLLNLLRELKLAGCSQLQELPDSIGNCTLLQCLDLSGTTIKELPDSIQLLDLLRELKLTGCSELQELPGSIGNCALLQFLDLSGTAIKELPDSIRLLDLLRELKLAGCSELQELPDSIGNCIFLQCLDLSGTAIKELPDSIRLLNLLRELKLAGCSQLQELPDSIGNCTLLQCLDLSGTTIKELPDSIQLLDLLRELKLTGCSELQELPGSIGNCALLQFLDLSGTAIKELPDSIRLLDLLRELKLAGCSELQELPDSIGNCIFLQCLDLSGTAIKELPDSIRLLNLLRELKLAGCSQLQELPDSIGNCTLLQCLDLSGTTIKELPDSIQLLDLLRELKLTGCSELQELPGSIGNCALLQFLDLSGTAIKELPDSIRLLDLLRELKLAGCSELQELPDSIGNCIFLQCLDLSGTAIKELPDSIRLLNLLRELKLAGCSQLQELPDSIGNCTLLQCLDLSGTTIKELPDSIQLLDLLRELKLTGCSELQELPGSIGNCALLQCLDLSGTAIKELPDSIQLLSKLRELKLAGCSELQELPGSISNCRLLECLDLSGTAIEELPDSIQLLGKLRELKLAGCSELQELSDSIGIGDLHETLSNSEMEKEDIAQPKLPPYNLELTNCFYGRQKEKDQVVEFLLSMADSDDDNTNTGMPVLGIVGPGGIGKTALARFVYEDHQVKAWFEYRVWLTFPSYQLDAEALARIMLGILKVDFDQHGVLQDLIPLLRKSLTRRRLLLVLDGSCVVHQWEILRACFDCSARGSAIILTTGTTEAALQMLADHVLHLDFLSMEHCWPLFSDHCFGNQRPGCSPQLEAVGRKILNKCCGVPLAAKMLGGLLHKKEYKEWVDILRSPEWDKISVNRPIPFVQLCFHDLPVQLQSCITYLSIFHKGYKFQKKQVVLLWVSKGLIQQEDSETMKKKLGYEYFDFLVERSFLIRSHSGGSMDFTMHELVHDLGLSLAKFISAFDGNGDGVDTSGLISDMQYLERTSSSEPYGSRTEEDISLKHNTDITNTPHSHVAKSPAAKVHIPIDANAAVQNTSDFRTSFERLQISNVLQLVNLPSTLHSLRIEGCHSLESLQDVLMNKCTNLVELHIIDCSSLKHLTSGWYPSSLRTLYMHKCRKLEFLLPALKMQNFEFLEHLFIGSSCESLKSLTLNLFPKLKLLCIWDCPNLESLSIEESQSNNLSLESLDIRDCSNLLSFPAKGLLSPCLRSLSVSNCKNLRSLPNYMASLTSLQSVFINRCPELESLPEGGLPSCLKLLSIGFCDRLIPQKEWNLKTLHCLHRFEIESGCMGMKSFPEKDLFPVNLHSLYISKLPSLEVLDYNGLQQLTALKSLEINSCGKLCSLPEVLPSSLTFFSIKESPMLTLKLLNPVGADWFKIAHISNIKIDDSVFSRYS